MEKIIVFKEENDQSKELVTELFYSLNELVNDFVKKYKNVLTINEGFAIIRSAVITSVGQILSTLFKVCLTEESQKEEKERYIEEMTSVLKQYLKGTLSCL